MTARIALLGTGLMGAPMGRRLLAAGFRLTVWNRTPEKAAELVQQGARLATSARAAVREAEFVISMLSNGPAVTEVLHLGGVADAMAPKALFIDMSSIPPDTARRHAALLAERGIAALDAPVSGGVVGAAAGTLAIMAGGELEAFVQALPVFKALGRATRVGPAGAGALAKLANQMIVGMTIGAVAEALLLAEAGGANPAAVREAIRGGFAESRVLELHGARMLARDFAPGAHAATQLKDLASALHAADEVGLELPLTREVHDLYQTFVREGGSELDHSALLLALERRNARTRK
jgi:2-hydroxy-3-oxopropionate reductase